jgi:hypothetical protein
MVVNVSAYLDDGTAAEALNRFSAIRAAALDACAADPEYQRATTTAQRNAIYDRIRAEIEAQNK